MKAVVFTEKERSRVRGYLLRVTKEIEKLPHAGELVGEIKLLKTVLRKMLKDRN